MLEREREKREKDERRNNMVVRSFREGIQGKKWKRCLSK